MRLKDIVLIVAVASLLLSSGCIWQDEKVVDSDGDGWDDEQELVAGTDPNNVDTDGDGYWDSKDENPLDPDIPILRVTPTPVETATPAQRPTIVPTPTPTPPYKLEITNPADDATVPRVTKVSGQGGEPGMEVKIHIYTEREGGRLVSGDWYPDADGNWEAEYISLWPDKGYFSGREATIYAQTTISSPNRTTTYRSENITVYWG